MSQGDKRALVTGGSGGIGAALCRRLARDGHHVYVHAHRGVATAAALVAEIHATGGRAEAIHFDLTDREGLTALQRYDLARLIEPAIATSGAHEEVRWALYRSWCRWPVSRVPYNGYQIPEWAGRTRVVSPRFVEYAHDAGLGVQVWTVDTADDARRLLGWGVDALITDRPDVVVPLVRHRD